MPVYHLQLDEEDKKKNEIKLKIKSFVQQQKL